MVSNANSICKHSLDNASTWNRLKDLVPELKIASEAVQTTTDKADAAVVQSNINVLGVNAGRGELLETLETLKADIIAAVDLLQIPPSKILLMHKAGLKATYDSSPADKAAVTAKAKAKKATRAARG